MCFSIHSSCFIVFLPVSYSSLLFLQVDNRPCTRLQTTCFPYATEAASFLRAITMLRRPSFPTLPELTAIITVRGIREEIGARDEETDTKKVKGKLAKMFVVRLVCFFWLFRLLNSVKHSCPIWLVRIIFFPFSSGAIYPVLVHYCSETTPIR